MPDPLAAAIDDCLEAGVNVLNVSTVLAPGAATGSRALTRALDRAARLGVLVVVASGRAEPAGGSALTGHPWVVPVTSCTWSGMAAPCANLGSRRGRRALAAPGCGITSLDAPDGLAIRSGSDAAAPFVTGAAALLWSASPQTSVDALRHALLSTALGSRAAPTPPLLDAWAAYEQLRAQRPAGPDLSLAP
jgi:subtilisin family serine protease